jgi:hypothetical protein
MTQEQAIQLVTDFNEVLENSGANTIVRYEYLPKWNQIYEIEYIVIMIPYTYQAKFETANTSQKFGFARLSVKGQLIAPFPSSYEAFNTKFESLIAGDTEMNNYLKK